MFVPTVFFLHVVNFLHTSQQGGGGGGVMLLTLTSSMQKGAEQLVSKQP